MDGRVPGGAGCMLSRMRIRHVRAAQTSACDQSDRQCSNVTLWKRAPSSSFSLGRRVTRRRGAVDIIFPLTLAVIAFSQRPGGSLPALRSYLTGMILLLT